ncbi:hypothetical protein HN51_037505 [Arachis hypogaea]|nr:Mannitol dehydrogenase [Arachis hypogaea]
MGFLSRACTWAWLDLEPWSRGCEFAKAFNMKVTVISTSPSKKKEALEKLGADAFLIRCYVYNDGIIDTVSGNHSVEPSLGLLKTSGKLIFVGAPPLPLEMSAQTLLMGRKMVGGSNIGGIEEMQEMVDFAANHNVTAEVEVIAMEYVNCVREAPK